MYVFVVHSKKLTCCITLIEKVNMKYILMAAMAGVEFNSFF